MNESSCKLIYASLDTLLYTAHLAEGERELLLQQKEAHSLFVKHQKVGKEDGNIKHTMANTHTHNWGRKVAQRKVSGTISEKMTPPLSLCQKKNLIDLAAQMLYPSYLSYLCNNNKSN